LQKQYICRVVTIFRRVFCVKRRFVERSTNHGRQQKRNRNEDCKKAIMIDRKKQKNENEQRPPNAIKIFHRDAQMFMPIKIFSEGDQFMRPAIKIFI